MESSLFGKTLGDYRIISILGKGGMGMVYLAKDEKLDREVAVKMMDAALARDPNFLKRFQSEARALAKLQNPNIVNIFALRETELGVCIVMEYVQGQTLGDRIKSSGALPVHLAVRVFKQLLNALEHAHKVGVIHRDIKPGNVLLSEDETAKLTDFGLAKIQEVTQATMTMGTGGTLFYMSPEQVRGLAHVDARGDIYSLGMTLYETLAGRVPFKDEDTDFAIRQSIVEGRIPTLEKFSPGIPRELARIVSKSIDKDPAKRYQTAGEMLQALEKFERQELTVEKDGAGNFSPGGGGNGESNARLWWIAGGTAVGLILLGLLAKWLFTTPTGNLGVFTYPAGANIFMDGAPVGVSPLTDTLLAEGVYRIRISRQDHVPVDTAVTIQEGVYTTLTLQLQHVDTTTEDVKKPDEGRKPDRPPVAEATLVLQAVPRGEVRIDGELLADLAGSPVTRRVRAGRRKVEFIHPEFGSKSTVVDLGENEQRRLNCYFEADVSFQALTAANKDFSGTIVIDGKNTLIWTPKVIPLTVGKHTVTLAREGWVPLEPPRTIDVKPTIASEKPTVTAVFRFKKR